MGDLTTDISISVTKTNELVQNVLERFSTLYRYKIFRERIKKGTCEIGITVFIEER